MREEFIVIYMLTKTNRKFYLGIDDKNNKVWNIDKNEAIWFNDSKSAENFANKWFKNFQKWKVEKLEINLNNLTLV